MRVRRLRETYLPTIALFAVLLGVGCDPKLTGTGGNDDDDNNDDGPSAVTNEAREIGQLVALHLDLLASSLAQADVYDSSSAGTTRSIFPTTCITVAEIDPVGPELEMSLDTCIDSNGTEYRGRALLAPTVGVDGYTLWPYGDASVKIIATNEANPIYNHTYEQGALSMTFERSGGGVTAVGITGFLRHNVAATPLTLSYVDFEYVGSPGSFAAWPANGGKIQVAWDGIGAFTVECGGSSTATFTLAGVLYALNLSTGAVTLPPS